MTDEKVYTPQVIEENPLPEGSATVPFTDSQASANETYTPKVVKSQPVPTRRVAYELLSSALNTRSRKILDTFGFTKSGAIQIGEYINGISGDVRLTPNGITARDLAGLITFALDALTGDAIFKGEVQAGSIISGLVAVGDNNIVIDGDARRMVFYDENGIPVILIGNA